MEYIEHPLQALWKSPLFRTHVDTKCFRGYNTRFNAIANEETPIQHPSNTSI